MTIRLAIGSLLTVLGTHAAAEACPPALSLTGDDGAVRAIREALAARGIEPDAPRCPPVHAHVAWRGDVLVIGIDGGDRASIEREVNEASTAATVIESFVRDDVGAPLLAARAVAPREQVAVPVATAAPAAPHRRGVHVFAALETSIGTDHTSWLGSHIGACFTLGAVCAAARIRYAAVVAGEGEWGTEIERRSNEVLLGLDIPIPVGRWTLTPGVAAGLGSMRTKMDGMTTGEETGGLRADVHATLSVPVSRNLALDLSFAFDLTQETHLETAAAIELPGEPLALFRFAVGARYGGL